MPRMRQAKFGIFGANVRYTDGRDVRWIRNDTIVTRGRTKIGIIGVSTVNTPTTTRAANVVGLRFDDPAPIVDSIGRALRKRGADFVVVIAHAGAFCDRDPACNRRSSILHVRSQRESGRHRERTHPHTRQHRGEGNSNCAGPLQRQGDRRARFADRRCLLIGNGHEVRELAVDTITRSLRSTRSFREQSPSSHRWSIGTSLR